MLAGPGWQELSKDADGHYAVHRSWKHFEAILDHIRDGATTLPRGYVPTTYDTRPASTDAEELLEFVREARADAAPRAPTRSPRLTHTTPPRAQAHFYGIKPLLRAAVPALLRAKFGSNPRLLELLAERGLWTS